MIRLPRYGDSFRHKKNGRTLHVATEPSGPNGCVRLRYDDYVSHRKPRRIWVYVTELNEKFDLISKPRKR